MDAVVKEKWIAALESGKYEQGQSRLRTNDDRYCCLGVLCDVAGDGVWTKDGDGDWRYASPSVLVEAFSLLPSVFRERVGLSNEIEATLASMNDRGGGGFLVIANYIRDNL